MKFQLYSDIHLEFGTPINLPGGDVLLIAGDIMLAVPYDPIRTDASAIKNKKISEKFLHEECAKYNQVFYIAGNHEYYHGLWEEVPKLLLEATKGTNVRFLQNETVDLGEVVLWAGTMWTDFDNKNPTAMVAAQMGMNDYRIIRKIGEDGKVRVLLPQDTVDENTKAKNSLACALEAYPNRKFLVMSHHAPTSRSIHPRYASENLLNAAYKNNLEDFILNYPEIAVWVHGHTHSNQDYMIGDTRVICNPRGYVQHGTIENHSFIKNFEFEV